MNVDNVITIHQKVYESEEVSDGEQRSDTYEAHTHGKGRRKTIEVRKKDEELMDFK